MKKLILSAAVLMFVGMTAFAQDNGSTAKKCCEKKSEMKCCKDDKCDKACMDKCKAEGVSCKSDSKSCTKSCATASAETKPATAVKAK